MLSLVLAVAVTVVVACGSDKEESTGAQQGAATSVAQEVRTPAAGDYTATPKER